jgi:hypothetical protein
MPTSCYFRQSCRRPQLFGSTFSIILVFMAQIIVYIKIVDNRKRSSMYTPMHSLKLQS